MTNLDCWLDFDGEAPYFLRHSSYLSVKAFPELFDMCDRH